jgi:allantoinase
MTAYTKIVETKDKAFRKPGMGLAAFSASRPKLVTEGTRRGMSYNHMARVTSFNAARRYGLNRKGDLAEGFDADIAIVDPAASWVIRAADSPSTQGYTPFEGLEMSARVDATFLRGARIRENGELIGPPRGKYLHRPAQ